MAMKPDGELEFINVVDHGGGGSRTNGAVNAAPGAYDTSSQQAGQLGFIRQSKHQGAAFFHYFFKTLAIFVYIFGGWVSSNFVFICVICVLLLAFDFWTVKNITGRLMVGLRWWSTVREDGTTEWKFESLENLGEVNSADSKLFWLGLYVSPLLWSCLLFVGLLKFNVQWLVIVFVALTLNIANIVGYTKCSNDAKQKVRNLMSEGVSRGAMAALGSEGLRNAMLSVFMGGGGSSSGNPASGSAAGTPAHV